MRPLLVLLLLATLLAPAAQGQGYPQQDCCTITFEQGADLSALPNAGDLLPSGPVTSLNLTMSAARLQVSRRAVRGWAGCAGKAARREGRAM